MAPADRLSDPTDFLSPVGRQILKLSPAAYAALVVPGPGNVDARPLLEATRAEDLVAAAAGTIRNRSECRAMHAGLWLYHDWLGESHRISQVIETPSGNFWHAIMHRREGDFPNAKYWYARCAEHPVLQTLGVQSQDVVRDQPADKAMLRVVMHGWDAAAFVDLVEQANTLPSDHPRHRAAVQLQHLEWRALFDHCTRAAAGTPG